MPIGQVKCPYTFGVENTGKVARISNISAPGKMPAGTPNPRQRPGLVELDPNRDNEISVSRGVSSPFIFLDPIFCPLMSPTANTCRPDKRTLNAKPNPKPPAFLATAHQLAGVVALTSRRAAQRLSACAVLSVCAARYTAPHVPRCPAHS
jgi:hypothetical protein